MKRRLMIPAILMAAGVATAGGLTYAKQSGVMENDAVIDLAKAKISLGQAVSTAETHAAGKATRAELEGERRTVVFNVQVVTGDNKVIDVRVDALDGKVLHSRQDHSDRGDKEDKDE